MQFELPNQKNMIFRDLRARPKQLLSRPWPRPRPYSSRDWDETETFAYVLARDETETRPSIGLETVSRPRDVETETTTSMVPGLKGLEYEERLEILKLLTLEERRNQSDLIELFKISRGLSAIPWNSFFRVGNSERTRGHSKKLEKEIFRLDVCKYFFSQRVLSRWNRLSKEVVEAGTVDTFKRRLEEFRLKMDFLKD